LKHKKNSEVPDHPPLTTQSVRLKVFEPNIDLWISPTPEYRVGTNDLSEGPYRVRTDNDGFIKSATTHEDPELTIAFIGGSTTECLYMDENKRFPAVSAALLEQKTGIKTNAINAGVSGANTLHAINTMINKILPIKPKIIVLMENINDLATQAHLGGYWNTHRTRSQIQIATPDLSGTTAVFRALLPEISWLFLNAKFVSRDEFKEERSKTIVPKIAEWSGEFEMNIKAFIELCRVRNILPVLMTQPNRFTPAPDPLILNLAARWTTPSFSYPEFLNAYRAMNETLRQAAREKNVLLIDLDQKIPKTKEFVYDTVHFNPTGAALAAEIISEELKKLKH
ncbi:MAG: SGNH/GDSL hydrolase family protein, partial [Bdellovibrionales bacterium]|nr:SGNH/GDSL hydrolase family protein [Bdellovibrionales bacterium]